MHFLRFTVSSLADAENSPRHRHLSFAEECLIGNDPGKYHYVAQGMLTIDNVDDADEMRITDEAFDVLGFTPVRDRRRNSSANSHYVMVILCHSS